MQIFLFYMLIPLALSSILFFSGLRPQVSPVLPQERILSQKEFSLNDRYPEKSVNQVFKDNILLNIAYMKGSVANPKDIDWLRTDAPFHYEFNLEPNKTFAYQDTVFEKYGNKVSKTTNAHFNAAEGFKSDGYLYGDGVCHLASLINWAARNAHLEVESPTNHNFANIPEVPKEYGVAIYSSPYSPAVNAQENLYVTNNKANPVKISFDYNGQNLKVTILEEGILLSQL